MPVVEYLCLGGHYRQVGAGPPPRHGQAQRQRGEQEPDGADVQVRGQHAR